MLNQLVVVGRIVEFADMFVGVETHLGIVRGTIKSDGPLPKMAVGDMIALKGYVVEKENFFERVSVLTSVSGGKR